MKRFLLSTCVAALLLSCTTSKRMTYLTIPQEKSGSFEPVNIDSILAKYEGHDGVYLDYERTIEHFGTKDKSAGQVLFGADVDWSYCDIENYRYVVLNPEASWLTHAEFWRRPDQLYIMITNPDGSARRYGVNHLKEESKEGEKIYRLIFPDIRRGSLVEVGREYTYSVRRYLPPLDHDIRLQFYVPCEKLSFSYAYPDWWQTKVKDTGPFSKTQFDTSSDPEKRKAFIRYSASEIPAILREPYSPYFKEICQYLCFRVTTLSMGGQKFDRELTWQDVAEGTYKQIIKSARSGKSKYEVNQLSQQLASGDTTHYEMMQAVFNYVRDSMELDYDYGKVDYPKAIKQKKGDLWELTGLARAMLRQLGITADLIMIHSAEDGFLDSNYVDYGQFSLPAVKAEVDGKQYVMLPYMQFLPFDHSPPFVQGQPAMVINEDGEWEFWTVPTESREENATNGDYRLTLSEDGNVSVDETRTLRGIAAYFWREILSDLTDTELEKTFKEFATFTGGDVTLESHEAENLNEPGLPLIIKLNYNISNVLTITPEEAIFHTAGLFAPVFANKSNFNPDYRQQPISIRADEQHDKNIEIIFPASWRLMTDLSDVSSENVFGAVSGHYTIGEGELRVNQSVVLNQILQDREKYPELLELAGDRSRLYLPNLVFTVSNIAP